MRQPPRLGYSPARVTARPSRRDLLRAAIDAALEEKPADFDALLSLVSGAG